METLEEISQFVYKNKSTKYYKKDIEARLVGEALRHFIFIESSPEGLKGCYSTFEVQKSAIPMQIQELNTIAPFVFEPGNYINDKPLNLSLEQKDQIREDFPLMEGYVIYKGPFRLEVVWAWDGDGWMWVRLFDQGNFCISVANDDIKKESRWLKASLTYPL